MLTDNLNHPALRRIPSLAHRAERDASSTFFAEGVRFVSEALASSSQIDVLVTCPARLTSPHGRRVLHAAHARRVPVLVVTPRLWDRITLTGDPQGIGAVVRQRWSPLPRAAGRPLLIAVEQVNSPGNLGTLLRTSEAVGATGAIFLGRETDPYDPAVIRATMGALFNLTLIRATHAEFARWKRAGEFAAIGTSPYAALDYREADFGRPTVLFLGCERRGMTAEQEALCDQIVRIPMIGRSDSLNLGVAASVLLYQAFGQRHPLSPKPRPAARV